MRFLRDETERGDNKDNRGEDKVRASLCRRTGRKELLFLPLHSIRNGTGQRRGRGAETSAASAACCPWPCHLFTPPVSSRKRRRRMPARDAGLFFGTQKDGEGTYLFSCAYILTKWPLHPLDLKSHFLLKPSSLFELLDSREIQISIILHHVVLAVVQIQSPARGDRVSHLYSLDLIFFYSKFLPELWVFCGKKSTRLMTSCRPVWPVKLCDRVSFRTPQTDRQTLAAAADMSWTVCLPPDACQCFWAPLVSA